jgi:hypothetical protein
MCAGNLQKNEFEMAHFAHAGHLGGITLPLEIFRDPRLNGAEIKFLVALLEFRNGQTGKCNVGGAQIESVSGLRQGNQNRTLKKLVKCGWLKYVQGSSITTNDYSFAIPLEFDAKYREKLERLPDEAWNKKVTKRQTDIKTGTRVKKRIGKDFNSMDEEDLRAEMQHEIAEGVNHIPDEVLESC